MFDRLKRWTKAAIVHCLQLAPQLSYRVIANGPDRRRAPHHHLRGMLVRAQVTRLQY